MPHLVEVLTRRRAAGKKYGIVIVAEGARVPRPGPLHARRPPDPFGHPRLGGIGNAVADAIEKQTGFETRCVVLGHLQRGGPPSAYDRVLATRLGLAASHLVLQHASAPWSPYSAARSSKPPSTRASSRPRRST